MKQKIKRKRNYIAVALAAGLMWSGASSAALTNGDFESGLTGWSGQTITDPNDIVFTSPGDVAPNNPTAYFDASSGVAKLTTDGGEYALNIFQVFTLQGLTNSANSLLIDFDLLWSFDESVDLLLAQMSLSSDPNDFILLSSDSETDITRFAGQEVELLFGLDTFTAGDTLEIDNIGITQIQATVPEPTTVLLISAGLLAMRRKIF